MDPESGHHKPLPIFVHQRQNMNIEFNRNEDKMKQALSELRQRREKIYLGGGKKAIEKQREKNKLTPRERIAYLTDKGRPFVEIGALAGYDMYAEQGGCPAGGTGRPGICKREAMCDYCKRPDSESRGVVSDNG